MVRIIVGTLIEVSEGRKEPHEIKRIIEQRDRRLSGPTAPPEGLYLYNVEYL
jgi:tRNA pseudouridine38-40 synthase